MAARKPGRAGVRRASGAHASARSRRRWLVTSGWVALVGLSLSTLWLTLRSASTTFHLSARTEEVRIYTGRGTSTSALPFTRVLLATGDTRTPLDGTTVRLSDGVSIRLHRIVQDTLSIFLEAAPGTESAGTVHREQRLIRTLGPTASFRVPLSGDAPGESFLLPFHARSLEVGNVTGFATRQRSPLLRSGKVTLTARTLLGRDFDAGAYVLRTGQRFDVPAPGGEEVESGAGLVLVEGGPGMEVEFSIRARSALVSSDSIQERLAAAAFDRVSNDQVIVLAWLLVVTLVLTPTGSVIADRMKSRAETFLNRP